ncbi:hypothetical protein HETIRDRAFT_322947 [Heterobasidion irregulare TC 32-1]|uniref:Uncharacterized protein n=1 Tax=Heterobasidion irregulare (strain TC 32-1) TaxID=747525 RepID=W4K2J5_HETIT|nr:uncharacterized protein HETIRDRAFT_322947 [Heterobasidion irregulare TC 32-1]ETW80037.1 hypothetical protein HETIRDRAFT_322947 [Heterobasidion irregulare TC 32-1]
MRPVRGVGCYMSNQVHTCCTRKVVGLEGRTFLIAAKCHIRRFDILCASCLYICLSSCGLVRFGSFHSILV